MVSVFLNLASKTLLSIVYKSESESTEDQTARYLSPYSDWTLQSFVANGMQPDLVHQFKRSHAAPAFSSIGQCVGLMSNPANPLVFMPCQQSSSSKEGKQSQH